MTDEEVIEIDRQQQLAAQRAMTDTPPATSKEERQRQLEAQARGAQLIVPVPGLRELPLG